MKNRNRICCEYCGFTLAEVLITIGILGVVAALVLPSFMTNLRERQMSERQVNIVQKVTHSMEHMRATGKLTNYSSTEEFVNELKKHLKIAKICDNSHLRDCWPTAAITDSKGNELDINEVKKGSNLNLKTETNNVGIILADGAHIILNYNPAKGYFDVGDRVTARSITLPVGEKKTKDYAYTTSVTDSVAFIMDVNGKTKPNKMQEKEKLYDIRALNCNKLFGCDIKYDGECLQYLGTAEDAFYSVSNYNKNGYYNPNWDNSYSERPYNGRIYDGKVLIEIIEGDISDFDAMCKYYGYSSAYYNPKSGINASTFQLLTRMISNAEFINALKGDFTTARSAVQKYLSGRASYDNTIIKLPVVCK